MSLIKYQNQYPKIWIILKGIKFYQKNDTQISGNNEKLIPRNLGIAEKVPKNLGATQKGTQKSGGNPKRYPK